MNLINTTKTALAMNNRQFGEWLGNQLNRDPFPHQRIWEYAHGKKQYPASVKAVCAPVSAHYIAPLFESATSDEIEEMLIELL